MELARKPLQPLLDAWVDKSGHTPEAPDPDFVVDADRYMVYQEPLRARVLVRVVVGVTLLLIVWMAITQIDEITRGEGKVIPSRQLQVLQSLDGGIVSEIAVSEGQVVEVNQLLLQVDSTRFESSAREGQATYLSLLAKLARLRAIAEGKGFEPPDEVVKSDPELVEEERRLYQSRVSELEAQLSISRQQLTQRQQELSEVQAKRIQAGQAYELSAKELAVTKPLIASGAVSEVELLRLERDVARFRGERDMASAQIARVQAAIGEANRKVQEVELAFRNDARKEMSDTLGKLSALSESNVGLADKVKHSAIRSPVHGTVKRLLINTVGGVVQPGKDVVEIVPLEDALLLEAKILPKDIAFLTPGQRAIVKFTAYDFAIYGGLEATLEQIGADSVTDEKGNTFFLVRVRTDKPHLEKNGKRLPIIPGMMAEVDIVTGRKSILTYLLKPVLRAKQVALGER